MHQKKQYPQKVNSHFPKQNSVTKPFYNQNRTRYQKGHQNQIVSASRKTETYTKDKTVIVTENFNIVDFNNDQFEYEFGGKRMNKNNKRRKY